MGNIFIRTGFKIATRFYYRDVQRVQHENVPQPGEPTMLCFNHSNGLSDPMLIMSATKRMVRFIAKDTLWKQWMVGWLVNIAAAVPVQRREDHGATADNQSSQQGVIKAFEQGHIVAVSPEGGSRMRTMLNAPFKKGFLFWAVDAVFHKWIDGDTGFRVSIVPCGLVYLHPTSWRSETMVSYGAPIVLDVGLLRRHGATDQILGPGVDQQEQRLQCAKQCVTWLAAQLEEGMRLAKLEVPPSPNAKPHELMEGDWAVLRLAVVATRILHQGSRCSLPSWVKVMQSVALELQKEENRETAVWLNEYASGLHHAGIVDAQVKRALEGRTPISCLAALQIFLCVLMSFALGALALPLLIPWVPLWCICLVVESMILRRGTVAKDGTVTRYGCNFDTIAQFKKSFGFISFCIYLLTGLVAGGWAYRTFCGNKNASELALARVIGLTAVLPILYVSMRLCEGCVAFLRCARERMALLLMPTVDLAHFCDLRRMLYASLTKLPLIPISNDDFNTKRQELDWHRCFFAEDLRWGGLVPDGNTAQPSCRTGALKLSAPLLKAT